MEIVYCLGLDHRAFASLADVFCLLASCGSRSRIPVSDFDSLLQVKVGFREVDKIQLAVSILGRKFFPGCFEIVLTCACVHAFNKIMRLR